MNRLRQEAEKLHRVVIVGGGFGGLHAALSLKHAPVSVTLLDARNFHLFQPLLYQVATGGLSPANIAAPLRAILSRQRNTRVLLANVKDIDVPNRCVVANDLRIPYDSLIVAAGARHHYFGHDDWEDLAPGLKTIEDATEIRRRILFAFEAAEAETDSARIAAWLTFVIVGGGATGVELAGAVAEIACDTLRHDFRNIDPSASRILLVEGTDRVLPPYPPDLSVKAAKALEDLGVTVLRNRIVSDIRADAVEIRTRDKTESIPAHTVLWAAGVQASPLGKVLQETAGAQLDRAGRVIVEPGLTVTGHPEIFVIGDMANYSHQTGAPLPGVAPVAMQQGQYVARLIESRLRGNILPSFHYVDRGSMATIGRKKAVAVIGRLKLSGYFAWLAWLFIHLMYIVEYENRLLVLVQWAWNYWSFNRAARLITGRKALQGRAWDGNG